MNKSKGNSSNKSISSNLKINSANECADNMLMRINECFNESIKGLPKIKSAVVSAVNDDGTVNVYFPPNDKKLFTRISNQGPFTLQAGDGVELMLKNGTFDNCWVIAKHGINRTDMNTIQNNKDSIPDSSKDKESELISVVGVTKTSQLINDNGFISYNTPTIYSANLTGTPSAPTAAAGTNTTQIATTAFVRQEMQGVSGLTVDSVMSTTSTNALQNKVITQQINALQKQIDELKELI